MSISRSIVDEIGGTLNVDSVPGEGTTISIDFPPPAEEAD
jgi:signal transduction histidine kinase